MHKVNSLNLGVNRCFQNVIVLVVTDVSTTSAAVIVRVTSVTTTNSLSQDYTNLDDQMSQTPISCVHVNFLLVYIVFSYGT